jgi:hypothetical protein
MTDINPDSYDFLWLENDDKHFEMPFFDNFENYEDFEIDNSVHTQIIEDFNIKDDFKKMP